MWANGPAILGGHPAECTAPSHTCSCSVPTASGAAEKCLGPLDTPSSPTPAHNPRFFHTPTHCFPGWTPSPLKPLIFTRERTFPTHFCTGVGTLEAWRGGKQQGRLSMQEKKEGRMGSFSLRVLEQEVGRVRCEV